MKPINLSPSFLSRVYSKGYDYAVGEKLGLIEKSDTKSMNEGRLFHAVIAEKLGGEKAKIAIQPYDSFRTNEAKAWRDSQPDDTFIIKEEHYKKLSDIADRVINHPRIKPILENPKPEQKIEKLVNGFNVKGIQDVIVSHNGGGWIDWKFVSSKIFDNFKKEALYSHYDLQAAVYDFLTQLPHGYFGVVENESPYRIKLYDVTPFFLESGADKFNKAFKILEKENWREPNFDIEEVGQLVDWGNMS